MKKIIKLALFVSISISFFSNSFGGITVYKKGNQFLKIGGRIQLQYHSTDPATGLKTDEVFFRRLRPYITGSLHENWLGKIQWDIGGADGTNELSVKDAYMQYKGFNNMKVTIGNAVFPFSRELITSSKKQQLIERTFVGDHNFGTPERNLGVHLTGHGNDKMLTWGFSVASASIDPSSSKLDFDSPVNKNADFNQGWIVGGRIDFHPFGKLKFAQGDFKRKQKLTIGLAAFNWSNDDDNNGSTASIDSVTGLEASMGYRNSGFSIDAQYNKFDADAVRPTYTSGLYLNGQTTLTNWAIEAGYMIVPSKVELVMGFQSQDADGYTTEWERTSFGINYFIKKQDIKLQLTFRQNENQNGTLGNDVDEVFLQAQYVF